MYNLLYKILEHVTIYIVYIIVSRMFGKCIGLLSIIVYSIYKHNVHIMCIYLMNTYYTI